MRLLIIDDEESICSMMQLQMRHKGYVVDSAHDGDQGLYLAATNNYDLIVLDNRLPKRTGAEVCASLRELGKETPIIVVSVLTDVNQKISLLNAGADDYLSKPFAFQELFARIRALLRRPRHLVDEVVTVSATTVDTKRRTVHVHGKEIHLTPKEFGIIEYLSRHAGVVITRQMILEHVWDMRTDPFSRTVESHVATLRKKLSAMGETNLIHTVPGRGYKIVA